MYHRAQRASSKKRPPSGGSQAGKNESDAADKGHGKAQLLLRQGGIVDPPADHLNGGAGFFLQAAVYGGNGLGELEYYLYNINVNAEIQEK